MELFGRVASRATRPSWRPRSPSSRPIAGSARCSSTSGFRVMPARLARLRDRLSPRDLACFLAHDDRRPQLPAGPPPTPKSSTQAERAAQRGPDSPDHWLLLGQCSRHYGAAGQRAGLGRAVGRSAGPRHRARLELHAGDPASGSSRPLELGDTAATRRFAGLLAARVTPASPTTMCLWAAARAAR